MRGSPVSMRIQHADGAPPTSRRVGEVATGSPNGDAPPALLDMLAGRAATSTLHWQSARTATYSTT